MPVSINGTGSITGVDSISSPSITGVPVGSASAPSVSFTGDTNTGLYSPGADQVALSTGGTGRLFIDSSGRIGLGTSSPVSGAQLTVAGASLAVTGQNLDHSANSIRIGEEGSGAAQIRCYGPNTSTNGSLTFKMSRSDGSNSQDVVIDSSGRVGIGTTSPAFGAIDHGLHIKGSGAQEGIRLETTDGSGGILEIYSENGGNTLDTRGSGYIRFNTQTTEWGRWDSSGRFLVGTSTSVSTAQGFTPSIQVSSTGASSALSVARYVNSSGSCTITQQKSRGATVGSHTVVQSGDSLGLLTFDGSDGTSFIEAASITAQVDGTPGANDMPGRLVFATTADGASSPTERARINASGQILIGKTSDTLSTAGWAIDGGSTIGRGQLTCGSSGAPILRLNHTGGASTEYVVESWKNGTQVGSISVTASATAYNTSSDYRLKENVVALTGAADRLNQLQVHRFNFIADPDTTVDGFIAHEAQAVVPECVTGEKDAVDADGKPVYQGIDQSKLVPLLTAALQETIAELQALKAEVAALKGA